MISWNNMHEHPPQQRFSYYPASELDEAHAGLAHDLVRHKPRADREVSLHNYGLTNPRPLRMRYYDQLKYPSYYQYTRNWHIYIMMSVFFCNMRENLPQQVTISTLRRTLLQASSINGLSYLSDIVFWTHTESHSANLRNRTQKCTLESLSLTVLRISREYYTLNWEKYDTLTVQTRLTKQKR